MISNITQDRHKHGNGYGRVITISESFADGYFAGWVLSAQLRDSMKKLIDVLDCAWVDPVTTRQLRVLKMDTTAWPISQLRWDVLLTRPDGWSTSTNTIYLAVERGETQ